MSNDDKIVENLVLGGIIGATLGSIILKDNKDGATIGAIAGAVILATLKASNAAKETQVPHYVQENSKLYNIKSDGSKHFVRNIEKPETHLSKHFKLKK